MNLLCTSTLLEQNVTVFLNRFLFLFMMNLSFSYVDSDWCLCLAMIYIFFIILLRIILLSEVCAVFKEFPLWNFVQLEQKNLILDELDSEGAGLTDEIGKSFDVSFPNHNEFLSLEWTIPEILWNVSFSRLKILRKQKP